MIALTAREAMALDFIREYQGMNDNMPTSRVLSNYLDMSLSGAHYVVLTLMRKGYLEAIPGQLGYRFYKADRPRPKKNDAGSGRPEDDEQVGLLLECLGTQPDGAWKPWSGQGGCPVPYGRAVEVRFRDAGLKHFDALAACRLRWHHANTGGDVVAFRLR